jgi:hypothetical protein
VKRKAYRFPEDFTFQLTPQEFDNLRCQFGISSSWGGRRHPPYAFTEQGVAMLSSVLRSSRALTQHTSAVSLAGDCAQRLRLSDTDRAP